MFDSNTPLQVDCGKLCGAACCGGDEDSGMLLFPGEAAVYKLLKPHGFKIEYSDLSYSCDGKRRRTPILFCDGTCDRYVRPLACRIFPLTPILDIGGKIEVITDPRAKVVCPLAKTYYVSEYEKSFSEAVKKAFTFLVKNKYVMAFMHEYTDYINGFRRFFPDTKGR